MSRDDFAKSGLDFRVVVTLLAPTERIYNQDVTDFSTSKKTNGSI